MFCAKCGKQIENDSTFCPFCGQQVDAPVTDTRLSFKAKPIINQSIKKFSVLQGILSNKMIWGIALALMAVLGVGIGAVKLIGGRKSASEKLLDMSWQDVADMSAEEYSDVLDDKDLLYVLEAEVSYDETSNTVDHVVTTMADSFLGGECYFEYIDVVHMSMFDLLYETYEDFKSSRKSLDEYLTKNLIKNSTFLTADYGEGKVYHYPVEVSNKKIDEYADEIIKNGNEMYEYYLDSRVSLPFDGMVRYNISLEDGEEALRERLSECSIYKFVSVCFENDDCFVDWDIMNTYVGPMINAYIPVLRSFKVSYVPLTEGQFATIQAYYGWDSISGKEIDIDSFKDSDDKKLVKYVEESVRAYGYDEEDILEGFKRVYAILYMMDKHDFDMVSCSYLKTKEEKRLWYINNFGWDTDTQAPIDLSDYRDSGAIYCAVEFNYNPDKAEYFESDLDKALYLADRNYKLGTGDGFESDEEKRLWLLENYSYDISSGEVIDKEIVDALIAYQRYIDVDGEAYRNLTNGGGYSLIYLDEDNIPELFAQSSISSACKVISYYNGNIVENSASYFRYAERNNFFCTEGAYSISYFSVEDGEWKEQGCGERNDIYDSDTGDWVYRWDFNGNVYHDNAEYSDAIDDFVESMVGNVQFKVPGGGFLNILEAYNALKTTEN